MRDSAAPFFSDTSEVVISIQDYNDNPPVFNPVSYSVKVREDVIPEAFLLQITATDSDTGSNQDFKFSIYDGDREGQFRIDPEYGKLYVHRRLDRETRAVYLLTVRATNTGVWRKLFNLAKVLGFKVRNKRLRLRLITLTEIYIERLLYIERNKKNLLFVLLH